jgi:hypothetical protein
VRPGAGIASTARTVGARSVRCYQPTLRLDSAVPSKTVVPAGAMPIAQALRESPALGRLSERLRLSSALFADVLPVLPPGLAAQVSAGPIDDDGWSILCSNAAVAAKLRQLVPHLEQRLREQGRAVAAIRIKVQPR